MAESSPAFIAYSVMRDPPLLVPASPARQWMDELPDRHGYRCLPLSIANAHGWCIVAPVAIEAIWNGGPKAEDIRIRSLEDPASHPEFVQSHFAQGILTFHTGYLFRTPVGWNTFVCGPTNHVKDGVMPLTGIVETSWLPFPFTMNWRFSRPCRVRWERGEPFCMVFPVSASTISETVPEIRALESNPELQADYQIWSISREQFLSRLKSRDGGAVKQQWQRDYFLGRMAQSGDFIDDHLSRLRPQVPLDFRPSTTIPPDVPISNASIWDET